MTGVILVGGRSRRMQGGDKTALRRDGRRVLEQQVELLAQICARVALVGREEQAAAFEDVAGMETFYADLFPECGPLGGLYTALEETEDEVFLLACDLPFIEADLLARLAARFDECDGRAFAVVPRQPESAGGRLEPLCSIWSRACRRPAYMALEAGDFSVSEFARQLKAYEEELSLAECATLRNINTPADLNGGDAALSID